MDAVGNAIAAVSVLSDELHKLYRSGSLGSDEWQVVNVLVIDNGVATRVITAKNVAQDRHVISPLDGSIADYPEPTPPECIEVEPDDPDDEDFVQRAFKALPADVGLLVGEYAGFLTLGDPLEHYKPYAVHAICAPGVYPEPG